MVFISSCRYQEKRDLFNKSNRYFMTHQENEHFLLPKSDPNRVKLFALAKTETGNSIVVLKVFSPDRI